MIVANGSADVTTYFVLRDSTNHAPKTNVTITDIDLYYVEQGAAISAKADATALAAADSAHADNKAYHVGQGLYRIDWPDEAFNGGVGKKAYLIVVCTGVDTTFLEVELSPPVNIHAISDDTTAADNAELMFDGTGYAGGTTKLKVDVDTIKTRSVTCGAGVTVLASVGTAATSTAQTGDAYAIVNHGTYGNSAIKTETAAILDDTGTSGVVVAAASKTGYSLTATTGLGNQTANITGNVSGSVGSVTGAVGSVTGNVGGSVASVTAGVTVTTNNDKTGYSLASTPPTAAAIADAVWDEAISGHLTAGTTGNALNAAGSAGDPWATALPGAYGAGTAGLLLGTTIPNAIDAIDNYVDTEVGALTTELAKVPKSDGSASWNATALAAIQGECTDALNAYDPPTNAEMVARTLEAAAYATSANQTTIIADTNELQTDLTNGGRLDLLIDGIKSQTDKLTFTSGNDLDCNVQKINDVTITGNGSTTAFGV